LQRDVFIQTVLLFTLGFVIFWREFMKKRVVVTGLGAVTPMGNDVPTMWDNLLAGRSGIDHITRFDASDLEVRIAAEVKGFDAEALFSRREARRNDPCGLFAMEAARQAMQDADLALNDETRQRAGAIIGTGIGGVLTLLQNYDIINDGQRRYRRGLYRTWPARSYLLRRFGLRYGQQRPWRSDAHHPPQRRRRYVMRWDRDGDACRCYSRL
jgi:hypothetical protein